MSTGYESIKKEAFYQQMVSGCSQAAIALSTPIEMGDLGKVKRGDVEKLSDLNFFKSQGDIT